MVKKIILIVILMLMVSGASYFIYQKFTTKPKFLSPEGITPISLTEIGGPNVFLSKKINYEIIGFLPYWLLNKSKYIQYPLLTQINYFGIEFDENGEIITKLKDGTSELGYRRLFQQSVSQIVRRSKDAGVSPVLTVKILNNAGIDAVIEPNKRSEVVTKIIQIMEQRNFTGLNIDLEYVQTPSDDVKNNFTAFMKELYQKLSASNSNKKNQIGWIDAKLTLDVYADTAIKQADRLWQLKDLAPYVDYFVIMGYDFHRATTPQAGPVAPIYGAPERWGKDLNSSVAAFIKFVSPQKLILGVPFYGYEWTTYTKQPNSTNRHGSGQLATYRRVKKLLDSCNQVDSIENLSLSKKQKFYQKDSEEIENCYLGFDEDALSPYIIYSKGSQYQQIWYENAKSLKYKLQLVKDARLGGIAIWAIGYEVPYNDLWKVIKEELID